MRDRSYMRRSVIVGVGVLFAFVAVAVRLGFLHFAPNEARKSAVTGMHQMKYTASAPRGKILDSRGNLLAHDLAVKDVWVDPSVIQSNGQAQAISAQLARVLGVDREWVLSRVMKPGRKYEAIKRNAREEEAARVERMRLKGVYTDKTVLRYYPLGAEGCHVLGYVNAEKTGSAGLEQRYEARLQGLSGAVAGEKDASRREIYTRRTLEMAAQEGGDVELTLDRTIQHYAETGVDWAMETFNCEAAWTIVEDVRTGAILAMACRPNYDPNEYKGTTGEERWNRAVGYNYEPGSIFKTLTVAAGINEGIIATNDVFDCEMGRWTYAGKPLKDFHPYGELDVTGILRKSSNIGAAKIAVMLGEARLERYLRAFGIGRRTGIELPGEEGGFLAPVKKWSKLDITRVAMGHCVSVTALQMVNALCCMGNDGILMKPYLVKRVTDASGRVLEERKPEAVGRPISERTARQMREMMTSVTQPGGTGTRAAVEGYNIAGKTGSAEKLKNGHYVKNQNMASFMGLVPAEAPQIGIIVVLDNPHPQRTGGVSAAPVFKKIAEPVIHYLDIRPLESEDALAYQKVPLEGWEPAPDDAVEVPED